jgi:hypothetical protein
MDFDSIKNKPRLTDPIYLQKVIENKKPIIQIVDEPTLIDKIMNKLKLSLYDFIENNLYIIIALIVFIVLLIYRYYQYQHIKNNLNYNNSAYYGVNYTSPYINNYTSDDINEHFNESDNIKTQTKKLIKQKNKNKKVFDTNIDHSKIKSKNSNIDNNEQHDNSVPDLLNIINDRSVITNNNHNLSLINSSSYAPYNLINVGDYHQLTMPYEILS